MVNIDDFTVGQLKEIAAVAASLIGNSGAYDGLFAKPLIGKFCIARCYSAGVHAGTVVAVDGENVVLKDSRRLWSWKAKDGVALSGVAQSGIDQDKCKVDVVNPEIYLSGVCELIPCTDAAKESIDEA